METIYQQVWIKAKPETVYEALTTQKGNSQWWITDCEVKPEVGFINEYRFSKQDATLMKILVLQQDKNVEWECVVEDDEWTGTHVIFELSEKKGITILNFRHTGWKAQTEFFAICSFHWARNLMKLKKLCESGQNQNDDEFEKDIMDTMNKIFS